MKSKRHQRNSLNDLNFTSTPIATKAEFALLSFECHKYLLAKTCVNKTFSV